MTTALPERDIVKYLPKRPLVDIEFQDIVYTAPVASATTNDTNSQTYLNSRYGDELTPFGNIKSSRKATGSKAKCILQGVSGRFLSGELTAILGPSGAGKSTLMNVLVGYISNNVSGIILNNGRPRQLRIFNKLCAYIMQHDLLQPRLTVSEAMHVAAELKLGREMNQADKANVIEEVISILGLTKARDTMTERLSGGQRKRLAVALELVNNPPVIFLDEPTTGLDTVASKQLLSLLQLLARQGRTIVCTTHQPSATVFALFDHVYVVNRGQCAYQGVPGQAVNFLHENRLPCPKSYNPADFILECMSLDNASILYSSTNNGKITWSAKGPVSALGSNRDGSAYLADLDTSAPLVDVDFPTSTWTQFIVLLKRMLLQTSRNRIALWIQLLHAIISAGFLGGIFYNIGDNVTRPFENFKFCIGVLTYFMYTHVMVPILIYPSEIIVMQREFFNRWYRLKPYYMALTVSTLPVQLVCGMVFLTICYLVSGQPLILSRYVHFSIIGLITGMVSEGFGLLVGSLFSCTNGSCVGPFTISPLLVLSVYGMGYGGVIEPFYQYLMKLSYLRFTLVGFAVSLYSYDRPHMQCEDEYNYCHYKDPKLLLRDLGMEGLEFVNQILGIVFYLILFRTLAYLALRYRLTIEFSSRILNYVRKILKQT